MVYNKKAPDNKQDYRGLIKRQAILLAELLQKSPEYIQFMQAKKRLDADEEYSQIINELRQQQITLRMAEMIGEESKEDIEAYESMYLALSVNPIVSEYLFAEGRLFHLIADIEEVFSDKLELWQLEVMEPYGDNTVLN